MTRKLNEMSLQRKMNRRTKRGPTKPKFEKRERLQSEPNNVRTLRQLAGMTLEQLAEKADSTVAVINRIENSASESVHRDLARAICKALGATMGAVFPAPEFDEVPDSPEGREDWRLTADEEGRFVTRTKVIADSRRHALQFTMRSGRTDHIPIDPHDVGRVRSIVRNTGKGFILFDSDGWTYAINMNQVSSFRIFSVTQAEMTAVTGDEPDDAYSAIAVMAGETEASRFLLPPADPYESMEGEDENEANGALFYLDMWDGDNEPNDKITFDTIDGDSVALRIEDIALFAVDKRCSDGRVGRLDGGSEGRAEWREQLRVARWAQPEMQEDLQRQLERFKEKFGREPQPGEPIFFDPDFDVPTPYDEAKMTRKMVDAMTEARIRPMLIHAYEKTGMIVTSTNRHLFSEDDLAEYNAAIDEYLKLHPDETES